MATNQEIHDAALNAVNNIATTGIAEWEEGQQRFRNVDPIKLLDLAERLEARAAEDAGARTFKPMVEFND